MYRISVLIGVVGTITTPISYTGPLPVGTEVIIVGGCGMAQAPAKWSPFLERSGYIRELLEQWLLEQYGFSLTHDPQWVGFTFDYRDCFQFYQCSGLGLLAQIETRHAERCPEHWHPVNCPALGCTTRVYQWGFPIEFLRWHERDLDPHGKLWSGPTHRHMRIANYAIAGQPQKYKEYL